jgi:putative copper resistance protein D
MRSPVPNVGKAVSPGGVGSGRRSLIDRADAAFSHGWPLFEPAQWPSPLRVKLALVAALLLLTLAHDLVLGPRVRAILVHAPNQRTASDRMVLAAATWLPRMALLLSLAVLFAAVSLVRS